MHPFKTIVVLGLSALLLACSSYEEDPNQDLSDYEVATFAGGCFWCVEEGFEKLPGVAEAVSGYAGGEQPNPTYEEVAGGQTRHTETVQVYYDPSVIEYAGLLEAFWRMMDPTDNAGQFVDRGQQYRPEIFYHNEEQRRLAEASMERLNAQDVFGEQAQVPITALENFYDAEEYHQDYYKKNPVRYRLYTRNSGRYQFVDSVWGEAAEQDFTSFSNDELLEGQTE
jgi:peptide methionine sulfoxide reductase msrA/msrB